MDGFSSLVLRFSEAVVIQALRGQRIVIGDKLLSVKIVTPEKVIFQGKADRVILPGEAGVFEVLPFHKTILSRLLAGTIVIDEEPFTVFRGVVKVAFNRVTIIMENKRVNIKQEKAKGK
ncbi:MAG: F0F1 ATP synthase subunit epsilon, partial [Candidatus Omnitrophica bacterium]|nr:F0F1 ATP synthase subunit epsilon [Candidatus Omnitrophota bacterium]